MDFFQWVFKNGRVGKEEEEEGNEPTTIPKGLPHPAKRNWVGKQRRKGRGEEAHFLIFSFSFFWVANEREGGKEFLIGLLKAELVDLDSTSIPIPLPPKKFLRTSRSGQNL